ncbi:hypothetical protein LINPERPRIM_LOCUS3675 [Linum perenne]
MTSIGLRDGGRKQGRWDFLFTMDMEVVAVEQWSRGGMTVVASEQRRRNIRGKADATAAKTKSPAGSIGEQEAGREGFKTTIGIQVQRGSNSSSEDHTTGFVKYYSSVTDLSNIKVQ